MANSHKQRAIADGESFFVTNANKAAACCGVSANRLRQWIADGAPGKARKGYDPCAILRYRLKVEQSRSENIGGADIALKRVKTERERLKLARERGEVLDTDSTVRVWRRYFAECRTVLLGLPQTITTVLPGEIRAAVKPQLVDKIDEVLGVLGRASEEMVGDG